MLYLIEILHQTTTRHRTISHSASCILLKFYIKPQRGGAGVQSELGCILLKFYIKPQLGDAAVIVEYRCILLKFYIKPQL